MRKGWAIAVFYLYLTAATVLLEATGVTAAWGVASPTGVTSAVGDMQAAFEDIQASGGLADTLFGSFQAAASAVEALALSTVALPRLLTSAGVPGVFVTFLFAPAFLLIGRDILHALTGRFP